jgi:hypothetical protein
VILAHGLGIEYTSLMIWSTCYTKARSMRIIRLMSLHGLPLLFNRMKEPGWYSTR